MKAIQTTYAGHWFRSRLEARWAVFFDHLGLNWRYEPEGYEVGAQGRRYLPDFFLPDTQTWIEVKPTDALVDFGLLHDCAHPTRGLPGLAASQGTTRGLMVLGPIPRHDYLDLGALALHPLVQDRDGEGPCISWAAFQRGLVLSEYVIHLPPRGSKAPADFSFVDGRILSMVSANPANRTMWRVAAEETLDAYAAARQSRFEHGESGAP